ncbi:Heat shock protein DnaJ-like protein [Nostoc sp. NIES-3756]|uniref:molecular chaperone DnaJ n=1 Tax=Nostoc sp. NIES-3756 TaxID=1751286 RepID=UPI00071FA76F|nr:molecular chaperone DnaJ [Nostoc sp. NIES-3756]BAT52825.1 Heat shock protein DnaJ-like protein [Nostoc sp. NIES-3756]
MEHNPYDILGVSQAASKAEITKAVAVAMKRKQYPVDVIAKAQKSLMKPEERIIADYLRPVLPPIQRFKYSDLSALAESAPTLMMLPQFDELEKAIAQTTQEEHREKEHLTSPIAELFSEGVTACQEGRYPKAIKYLEDYCHKSPDRNTQAYIQAQMWLIRAYQLGGQLQRAIALCQMLVNHPHPQVQDWANKTLPMLSKETSRV